MRVTPDSDSAVMLYFPGLEEPCESPVLAITTSPPIILPLGEGPKATHPSPLYVSSTVIVSSSGLTMCFKDMRPSMSETSLRNEQSKFPTMLVALALVVFCVTLVDPEELLEPP